MTPIRSRQAPSQELQPVKRLELDEAMGALERR